MKYLEEIRKAIECGKPKDTERLIRQALEDGENPAVILEDAMVPAMRTAGEAYRREESDIPKILLAARSMQKGLNILEPILEQDPDRHPGTVILGTVEGDLHDLGKNLVGLMFRSSGFEVVDLGVDISEKQFLKAIKENPDVSIVCLSSLLNTSVQEMAQVVKKLRRNPNRTYKILVGGGAVTRELAEKMGADAYTETAADCAMLAKKLVEESTEEAKK